MQPAIGEITGIALCAYFSTCILMEILIKSYLAEPDLGCHCSMNAKMNPPGALRALCTQTHAMAQLMLGINQGFL